jgi:hypothetical protein
MLSPQIDTLELGAAEMAVRRAHVVIPEELIAEIDGLVGRRGRSSFLARAAAAEVRRLRQLKTLREATGAWKDADHPELKGGAARWVARMRKEGEKRSPRTERRR